MMELEAQAQTSQRMMAKETQRVGAKESEGARSATWGDERSCEAPMNTGHVSTYPSNDVWGLGIAGVRCWRERSPREDRGESGLEETEELEE